MAVAYSSCKIPSPFNSLQILPTCEEMLPAVVKFGHLVIDEFSACTAQKNKP